ncbi:MAG TPA: helix-turn-helix transcriptional regulator [Verrucomicrobiae bacterium]|nr:helix-turn-helix transcriptional regulator [Verrucomicrobiae bacterium]
MPTVAEQLRAAREARQLTVQQVADMTKIRTDHIRALEDGNFNRFPAPIYIRGSVKNYAAMLKLDVPQVLTSLDAELKGTEKFSEPPSLVGESKSLLDHVMFLLSKVNVKVALALGGVLVVVLALVLAGWAWRQHEKNKTAPDLPPAVYQPPSSGNTLPLPKN